MEQSLILQINPLGKIQWISLQKTQNFLEFQAYLHNLQADKLSLAFITGKSDSVMLRVDSAQSDYLQIALVKYKFLEKNKVIRPYF